MTLRVSRSATPGGVKLDWTGGQPTFSVYRSTSAPNLVNPANLIGTTNDRAFPDTPPPGVIYFYEIGSPCVYAPPEICNGLDDDCNGTVDGPGSEASCSLPHATPTCSEGACAIAACDGGWGDCNTENTDGCESSLGVAQSTSPSTIWESDPDPNKDLKPGFVRVSGITNCGACGVTCDDGLACTTDLCSMDGTCRHYSRAQCAEARCGGMSLPPGTPPPGDAGCTGLDTDGDGLSDAWETVGVDPYTGELRAPGIDLDCDGEVSDPDGDMVYSDPPAGPSTKDVYLKIAYMAPSSTPGEEETESHAPVPGAIDAIEAAFAAKGITLHVDPVMPEVPHSQTVFFPVPPPNPDPCATGDAVSLYSLKGASFDPRLKFSHKYLVFAHDSCSAEQAAGGNSGLAEIHGNDGIVSLAEFTYSGGAVEVATKKLREEAGTMMHELGHTFGLDHDGPDGPCHPVPCGSAPYPQKPNYISSMNHSYQLGGILRAETPGTIVPLDPTVPWRVDFSSTLYGVLDELALDEISGLTGAVAPYDRDIARYYCPVGGLNLAPGMGPVDWNCDSVASSSIAADIDLDGSLSALTGATDWGSLDYNFQCNPTFIDGTGDPAYVTPRELTLAQANARGVRATILCASNADCDDGAFCNGAETCSAPTGTCQPGTPPVCDDLDPCTVDTCDETTISCLYTQAANGTPCAGSEFCVVGQVCTDGICGGGAPRDCEDGLPCTADVCSEPLAACTSSCTSAPCWTTPVGPGVASAPASNTASSYVVKGNALYAIRNTADATGAAGSIKWTWLAPSGAPLENFPNPVVLSPGGGGGEYLFIGAADGLLYKIHADDGAVVATADTRRPSCASDGVRATPAIQLYRFSNPAFQNDMDSQASHTGDDVVFVVTRNGCSDTTRNRIIAYYASNLERKWTFNEPSTHKMDFVTDGCAIDYANNRLYCGSSQPEGGSQNTLWAIDSTSSAVIWSTNAGSIQNRPILHSSAGKLYVVSRPGSIMAYDAAGDGSGGALRLWTAPAVAPTSFTLNPWIETRPGAFAGTILVVDSAGRLTRFTDAGDHATKNWSIAPGPGLTFTSVPMVDPVAGSAYIGRNDGYVQQINLSTGATEALNPVAPPETVYDPSLDAVAGSTRLNRLTVAAGSTTGTVAQYCTWPPPSTGCTSNAECAGSTGACYTGTCDLPTGVCVREPLADGTACNDGLSCTSTSTCESGTCQSDNYTACPCANPGDAACAPGFTCCGSTGCKNLLTDSTSCGSCGNTCPADRACSEGQCVARPAACTAPTAATLNGVASLLLGSDDLAFDRLDTAGSTCSGYLSSYRYPAPSVLRRVDPAGAIASMTSPSPDSAPLNGVAVPREGNHVLATAVNRQLGSFPTTTPGMIAGAFSPAQLAVALATTPTYSSVPFDAKKFDQGPVGPALDYHTYTTSGGTQSRIYYANWGTNGDVVELSRTCSVCTWSQAIVPVTITPPGSRITAIAFSVTLGSGPTTHRKLYVAHGTTLSIVDLGPPMTQVNVDLAAGLPQLGVTSILDIAVQPAYGDIFVEAKNAASRFIINVDAHDQSSRHALDVQIDLRLAPLMPFSFADEGRLVFMPDGQLLRLVPGINDTDPPVFQRYVVTK